MLRNCRKLNVFGVIHKLHLTPDYGTFSATLQTQPDAGVKSASVKFILSES